MGDRSEEESEHLLVNYPPKPYPTLTTDSEGSAVVSHAGSALLTQAAAIVDLGGSLRSALRPWQPVLAVHHLGKIALDLPVSIAIGGDALSDLATLRAEPGCPGWWPPTPPSPA